MRIALITSSFLPKVGGAEFVVHHLARQWHKQGHEVCVINPGTSEATHAEGAYTVKQLRLLRGTSRFGYHRFPWGWDARRKLERLLSEFQPDFISAHFGYPIGVWLSQMRPVPKYIVTCHGGEITPSSLGLRSRFRIDALLREALSSSVGAIAISRHARFLMEGLGVAPSKILDIPNGVDVDRFAKKVEVDIRGRLGVPKDSIMILSVGRERPEKAFDTGIKAFSRLVRMNCDVHYVLLGRGTDRWGPLAADLGVEDRVIFWDDLYGEELVGAYQQADIFFSPSDQETLALVVLEGMAAGLPQVVTNVSGSQDVVETGCNGIVVEPGDSEAMAKALYRLVSDHSLRSRMGVENANRSTKYSWDHVSRLYLEHAPRQRFPAGVDLTA